MKTRPAKRVTRVGAALLVVSGLLTAVTAAPGAAASCETLDGSEDATTTYTGTDGKDLVCVTEPGDYVIDTGGGNDKVTVTDADATVEADLGPGNDTYTGTVSDDAIVDGDTGNDKVTTGSGDDTVDGGTGNDKITMGAGDDTADGGAGTDSLSGGTGDDDLSGGTGNDTISDSSGDDTLSGGDGKDKLTAGPGDDTVSGGGEVDKIDAGTGDDVVDGGSGDDLVAGGTGDDDLSGGSDSDIITDSSGNDTLDGGDGMDSLAGGSGIDALSGGTGNDSLNGGDDNDGFDGTSGDTAISGAGGASCSDESTLNLTCSYGAAVVTVDSTAAPVDAGWRVTVRAHVLDFDGIGSTKIALAEYPWTTPTRNVVATGDPSHGVYLSAVPNLVGGTLRNGDFEATFDLATTPTSGQLGIRVFTQGFSIKGWSLCSGSCWDPPIRTWPCISSATSDAECGLASALGGSAAGFPRTMRAVILGRSAPADPILSKADPTLGPPEITAGAGTTVAAGYLLTPTETTGVDRTFAVGSARDLPCSALGSGSLAFRVMTYAIVESAGTPYGWFAWPSRTTLTLTCSEAPRLWVLKTGSGSGSVYSSRADIACGIICSVSPSLAESSSVFLSATPAPGSVFAGWSGACHPGRTDNLCLVEMQGSKSVTATFLPAPPLTVNVSIAGSGAGTVSTDPTGMECADACSAEYPAGETVTVTATPDPDSTFVGWTDLSCGSLSCWWTDFSLGRYWYLQTDLRCSSSPSCVYRHGGDVSLVAIFARISRATNIASGHQYACAVLASGSLKCWGRNDFGQLGLGNRESRGDDGGEMGDNLPAVDLGTGRTALQVASQYAQTCALLDDGSVKCWGNNEHGRLGLGDTESRGDGPGEMGDSLPVVDLGTGRTAVSIAIGAAHVCALLDDGSVKCWGNNGNGQLGVGDTESRGDGPGEMGDNLPAVDLGEGRTAVSIDAGDVHTCALLDDASLKCWGNNGSGELGLGDTESRGDGPGEMGDNLPAVDLGTGLAATAISLGSGTCAILDNGALKCWGWNYKGLLGAGDDSSRGDEPGEMGDNLLPIDLGAGRTVARVNAGGYHTCAVMDTGAVKCWGSAGPGMLGLGDLESRGDSPGEMGDSLPAVDLGVGVSAEYVVTSTYNSCALLRDGSVKCWGDNDHGLLGHRTEALGDEPGEMGDGLLAVPL